MDISDTLRQRGARYGAFPAVAGTAQGLKDCLRAAPGWGRLNLDQRETLDMVASKIARILNGDPDYQDNWHDIAGYAALIEARLKDETRGS